MQYHWEVVIGTVFHTAAPPGPGCLMVMNVSIYTYIFVVDFDALALASEFRIERRRVVFLFWMQDSKLRSPRHQIASRRNDHSQTDWAIEDHAEYLNSTARPYDKWALPTYTTHTFTHTYIHIVLRPFCPSWKTTQYFLTSWEWPQKE